MSFLSRHNTDLVVVAAMFLKLSDALRMCDNVQILALHEKLRDFNMVKMNRSHFACICVIKLCFLYRRHVEQCEMLWQIQNKQYVKVSHLF